MRPGTGSGGVGFFEKGPRPSELASSDHCPAMTISQGQQLLSQLEQEPTNIQGDSSGEKAHRPINR